MSLRPGYRCSALRREQFRFDEEIQAYRRVETIKEKVERIWVTYPNLCLVIMACAGFGIVLLEMFTIRSIFGTP